MGLLRGKTDAEREVAAWKSPHKLLAKLIQIESHHPQCIARRRTNVPEYKVQPIHRRHRTNMPKPATRPVDRDDWYDEDSALSLAYQRPMIDSRPLPRDYYPGVSARDSDHTRVYVRDQRTLDPRLRDRDPRARPVHVSDRDTRDRDCYLRERAPCDRDPRYQADQGRSFSRAHPVASRAPPGHGPRRYTHRPPPPIHRSYLAADLQHLRWLLDDGITDEVRDFVDYLYEYHCQMQEDAHPTHHSFIIV